MFGCLPHAGRTFEGFPFFAFGYIFSSSSVDCFDYFPFLCADPSRVFLFPSGTIPVILEDLSVESLFFSWVFKIRRCNTVLLVVCDTVKSRFLIFRCQNFFFFCPGRDRPRSCPRSSSPPPGSPPVFHSAPGFFF